MKSEPVDNKNEPEQLRKMFIGGLDYGTTDEGLKEYYEQWGTVVDVVVMKDPKTRRSRGFGFITYSEASMVDDAMSNRPHKIDGRHVEPKRAVPRDLCGKGEANVRKLFIGGIGKTVKKEDLEEYFGKFGNLTDCAIVVTKDTGEPRGFGFVEYDDVDSADKVILIRDHEIKGRRVEIKKAIARDDINKNDSKGDRGRGGRGGGYRDGRGGGGDFRNGQGNFGGGGGGGGGGWNNNGGNWGPNNNNNNSPWSNQPPQMGNWGNNQAWGNNPCWGNNQNGYPQGFNNMGMGGGGGGGMGGNMGGGMGGNMGGGMGGNMGGGMGGNMGGGGGMGMGNMGNMGMGMGGNMGSGLGGGMGGMGCGMGGGMGGMLGGGMGGGGGGGGGLNNSNNMYGGGNMGGGGMGFNNNYGGGSSGGGPMRGNYGSSNNRPTPYSTSGGGMNDRRGGGGGQYSNYNSDKGGVRRDGKKSIRC